MTARVWSARGPVLLGLLTLVTLIGGFGAWSVLATITGAIVSSGQIQVEQNRQVVQHPDGGVVEAIAVTEGQAVAAGDLLVRLDGSLLQSELAIVEGQFVETRARRARLEAERDDAARIAIPADLSAMAGGRPDIAEQIEGQLRLFDARRDTLARQTEQMQKRLLQIGAQNQGITAQAQALTTQLRLIGDELASQRELLANGLTQSSRVSALEREEADLLGRAGELTAARAQNEGRATEIDLEILRLAAARREEASTQLRDIGQAELELAERRRALTERIARLDIRAPVSGLVLGLQVTTPRAVIRPADPVLYLIPQDRPLVIAVNIQPIHIDEVHIGQDVRLMFPAFSSRTTPELMGKVAVVSADALTDQASGMTFYRAEIVLNPGEVEKLQGRTLLPGMPVETFIQTAARTPLAYLIQPFTDYFQAAFRES
ncbi:MAG: HlyD family type I secretion periplasmic adaptor subunit [Pseudomonadota bacterium]